jgi:hypothetical protein
MGIPLRGMARKPGEPFKTLETLGEELLFSDVGSSKVLSARF